MKKKLLITAPYFDSIGGTEIEAVNTAVYFYDTGVFNKISFFSPNEINKSLFQNIIGDRKFEFLCYPSFFTSPFINLINRLFFKFEFKFKLSEFIYWKYKSFSFSTFYILAYSKATYFVPLLKSISSSKKIIGKITMGHYEDLTQRQVNYYKRFDNIIMFNVNQKKYWISNYNLKTLTVLDIMIPNEVNLLNLEATTTPEYNKLVFGFLGRISEEKNILDQVLLLDFLNNKNNYRCELIIQGEGDIEYIKKLEDKIKELKLVEFVKFNKWFIEPMVTHKFMETIDVFLVTSIHEGGPITALEAAASGKMVMGYDIGAMKDRFSKFPYCINNSFEDLCVSTLSILSMDLNERSNYSLKFREHYIMKLNNQIKGISLLNLM